jgi:predicted RNA-binding protein with RPS1 domain
MSLWSTYYYILRCIGVQGSEHAAEQLEGDRLYTSFNYLSCCTVILDTCNKRFMCLMDLWLFQAAEVLRPGMVRDFTILGQRKEIIQLSMAVQERAIMWQRLRKMQEEDITMAGTVVSANRGGVMVQILNTRGFVPNSHLGMVADKENLMGQELQLKFLEVDEQTGKVLLSARRVQSVDSLTSYRVGDVVEAVVTRVMNFGAFLEVSPGVTGLLHISQVSHDRVTNMESLVQIGDRMKVPLEPLLLLSAERVSSTIIYLDHRHRPLAGYCHLRCTN